MTEDNLRPWQATELILKAAEEIPVPMAVSVTPEPNSFRIAWQRPPGSVDGYAILLGKRMDALELQKRVPFAGFEYEEMVGNLQNGVSYFVTVVAYRGERQSGMPGIWKVTPNNYGLISPAAKAWPTESNVTAQPLLPTTITVVVKSEAAALPAVLPVKPAELIKPVEHVHQPQQPQGTVLFLCQNPDQGDVVFDEEEQVAKCKLCHATYVQRVSDKKYIPVAMLPHGVCSCCRPKRPLYQQDPPRGPVKCTKTKEEYIKVEERGFIRVSKLDYGLCTCCVPKQPLEMSAQQGVIVCSRQKDHLYVRRGKTYVYRPPEEPMSTIQQIDESIDDGMADMLPGGILVPRRGKKSPKKR